jgi:hypothetical protein
MVTFLDEVRLPVGEGVSGLGSAMRVIVDMVARTAFSRQARPPGFTCFKGRSRM